MGTVNIDDATMQMLSAQNVDISTLTLKQLEHEAVRLETRLTAVKERIVELVKTKKRVRKRCSEVGCGSIAVKGGVCKKQ